MKPFFLERAYLQKVPHSTAGFGFNALFFPWGKKSETIVMMPPKTTPRGWFMVTQKQGPGAQDLNQ